jgi:hypothetical protein
MTDDMDRIFNQIIVPMKLLDWMWYLYQNRLTLT